MNGGGSFLQVTETLFWPSKCDRLQAYEEEELVTKASNLHALKDTASEMNNLGKNA